MPRSKTRALAAIPRYTLTRREAAASLGISINHFERAAELGCPDPEASVSRRGTRVSSMMAARDQSVSMRGGHCGRHRRPVAL